MTKLIIPKKGKGLNPKTKHKQTPSAAVASLRKSYIKELTYVPRVLLLIDGTGSMSPHWESTRQSIATMLKGIAKYGKVELKIAAYRDFEHGPLLYEASPWTAGPSTLKGFLNGIQTLGGETWEEAVEVALEKASQEEQVDRILLIGDAAAHAESNWKMHAKRLGQMKRPVYAFVVGNYSDTISNFKAIAKQSGGLCTQLANPQDLLDVVVMTAAEASGGADALEAYIKDSGKRLSSSGKSFGQKLLNK